MVFIRAFVIGSAINYHFGQVLTVLKNVHGSPVIGNSICIYFTLCGRLLVYPGPSEQGQHVSGPNKKGISENNDTNLIA